MLSSFELSAPLLWGLTNAIYNYTKGGIVMPNAQKLETTDRKELTSLEEGFVVLKRMSYGESVQRRAMMKLSFATGGSGNNKDFQGEMAMASVEIQIYEFQKCIVDHNLEDAGGNKMNFQDKRTLDILDPKIGGEIEALISKMNDFDSEDDTKN